MPKHQQIQALLVTYDELDAPTRQQVDEHLAICPTCAAMLAAYHQTDSTLRTWTAQQEAYLHQQPTWSTNHRPAPLHRAAPRQRSVWRDAFGFRLGHLRTPLLQTAGAAILLLLFGFLLLSFSGWFPVATPVRAATPTVVTSPLTVPTLITTPIATGRG